MTNSIARFEIAATDLPALRDFYGRLFGWRTSSKNPGRYDLIEAGGGIPGLLFKADAGVPTFVTVYVEVDDVEKHLATAEELGGTVYVPATPSPVPGERVFAVFGDPEGNIVGICERD